MTDRLALYSGESEEVMLSDPHSGEESSPGTKDFDYGGRDDDAAEDYAKKTTTETEHEGMFMGIFRQMCEIKLRVQMMGMTLQLPFLLIRPWMSSPTLSLLPLRQSLFSHQHSTQRWMSPNGPVDRSQFKVHA